MLVFGEYKIKFSASSIENKTVFSLFEVLSRFSRRSSKLSVSSDVVSLISSRNDSELASKATWLGVAAEPVVSAISILFEPWESHA